MPTVSKHHVNASLAGFRRQGGDINELLLRAGINPSTLSGSNRRVHTEQVGRLFRLIQQEMNDEFMGFTANPCEFGTFSTFCQLARRSANLGELLESATHLYKLLSRDVAIELSVSDSQAQLSFTFDQPDLDQGHFLAEFLLVIWHRFPSWYIGETIRLRETHFVCAPPSHEAELAIMFPSQLRFSAPSYTLVFDPRYLEKELNRTEEQLATFLDNYPVDIMAIPGVDESLEARIERLLFRAGNSLNLLGAEHLARELGMSKVTLYRKLQNEGTSYQRIKDNIRREKSIELLRHTELTVDEISEIAGFSEARSFTRAFRTWTGLSPRQYRNLGR